MGAGSFFAGLAKGFAGGAEANLERKTREEAQRRQARIGIITTALPHIQDPTLQAEALSLIDEFATGKSKAKGGLAEIFGPLIGRIQPRDEGQQGKLQEFLTRPREAVVRPAGQTAPNVGVLPSKPIVNYLPLSNVPGMENAVGIAHTPAPQTFALDPLPIPEQRGTVKGPFVTPAEKTQAVIGAKVAERAAMQPFEEAEARRKLDFTLQVHQLDAEARQRTAEAAAIARAAGTQHSVRVHKEGGAPWEYVERRINNLGQVVSETPVDAPAKIMADYHTAVATKKPGETIEQAYNRVLGLEQSRKEAVIKNLKGSEAERAQRMANRAKLEKLKEDIAAGGVKSAQQARLALNQIRAEVMARRRDKDDPLAEKPFEEAFQYVAAEYGAGPEQLEYLRSLSIGKALPNVPGTGGQGGAATGQPPAEVIAQMPVGRPVTFKNGQTWQKDASGRVSRVR
jgi:hypothetical protein